MSAEKLLEYMGGIDDRYVEEAAPGKRPARIQPWGRAALTGVAAVLAVLVGIRAADWARWRLCDCAAPEEPSTAEMDPAADSEEDTADAQPPRLGEAIGDAPGHIRWHGGVYCDHGNAAYELPEGLELLGETNQVVEEGGIVPEDAGDLSANIDGYVYWFPGNENLIVFRYKDWDASYAAVELGRREPFLLMFRETDEEEPHQPGQPYNLLPDMMEDSDLIVEGSAPQPAGAGPAGAGEAVYTLRADSVLAGYLGAETLQVRIPADSGLLEASSEGRYLLFLRREADGAFRPVSASQGVYPIVGKFLHVPASDPCRMKVIGVLHTSDSHFWYAMKHLREWIQEAGQSGEP